MDIITREEEEIISSLQSLSMHRLNLLENLNEESLTIIRSLGECLSPYLFFHQAVDSHTTYEDETLSFFERKLAGYIIHRLFLSSTRDITSCCDDMKEVITEEIYLLVLDVLTTCLLRFPIENSLYLMRCSYPIDLLHRISCVQPNWIIMTVESTKHFITLFGRNIYMMPVIFQDQFDENKLVPSLPICEEEERAILMYLNTSLRSYIVFLRNMLSLAHDCHRTLLMRYRHPSPCDHKEQFITELCSSPWLSLIFFGTRKIMEHQ